LAHPHWTAIRKLQKSALPFRNEIHEPITPFSSLPGFSFDALNQRRKTSEAFACMSEG
jgi:hypothetical protein